MAAVEWRKKEKNMTLNHWKIMQRTTLLTKLLNYSFTCTALLGMTQRMFGTFNWYSFIWNVQMSTCIHVWENTSLHTGINTPFYLFIIFVGLGTKCKILNFCFLVFLTMLFLHLSLALMDSAEVMGWGFTAYDTKICTNFKIHTVETSSVS